MNSWWPGAVSWLLPHGMNGSSSLFSFGGEGKGPGKGPQSDRSPSEALGAVTSVPFVVELDDHKVESPAHCRGSCAFMLSLPSFL